MWIVDLRINGFDIFNNSLGLLMIIGGLIPLIMMDVNYQYRLNMAFVLVSSLLIFLLTLAYQFHIFRGADYIFIVMGLITTVAINRFASSFMVLLKRYGLNRTKNIWRKGSILFLVIYEIPFGTFCLWGVLSLLKGQGLYLSIYGIWSIPVIAILCLPLVYLLRTAISLRGELK